MNCRICGTPSRNVFQAKCLDKYHVAYYLCDECRFLQTEEPYWLEEAYLEPINRSDTGIISRNLYLSNVTASVIFFLYDKNGRFLDYAGGYGILTRMMRDYGLDYYWHDIHSRNIFAKGFEFDEKTGAVELVTCYEAVEHFAQPMAEMEKMLRLSDSILFSTELLPWPVPRPDAWWYYGLEHGQHVSFYSARALRRVASRFGMNFFTDNKYVHLLTKQRISDRVYRALVKASSFGLGPFLRIFMRSKTFSDMEHLIASSGGRDS